jgi:uncharacterized protein YegL
MARKLPVYLLLDTSGSMSGEPIEQVKNGVQMLISALRADPYALETVHIGVITFDSSANVAVPLTELTAFQQPSLHASGTPALGEGLRVLAECASNDVVKSTSTQKGDWKPMVFMMTDGGPTDDWIKGLARFRMEKWGIVVACAVDSGDDKVLKSVAGEENVVRLNTSNSGSMAAFFKWVTASVSASSKSVETAGKEVTGLDQLPPPPPEIQVVT